MTRSTTGWSAAALATGRLEHAVMPGPAPKRPIELVHPDELAGRRLSVHTRALLDVFKLPTPHVFRFEPHGTGTCQRCGGELTAAWHV